MAEKTKLYNLVETIGGTWHIERRRSASESRTYCGRLIVPSNRYRGSLDTHGAMCSICAEAAR